MIELYTIDITRDREPTFDRCINLVSEEKRKRIYNFRLDEDKKRSLYSDVLIRWLAVKKLEITNKQIIYKNNQYGKPFLANVDSDFKFNISHSGKWVVAAISRYDKQYQSVITPINNKHRTISDKWLKIL